MKVIGLMLFYLTAFLCQRSTSTPDENCGPICRVKKFGKKHIAPLFSSDEDDSEDLDKHVAFRLYTRETVDNPQLFFSYYYSGDQVPMIDRSKPIKVAIHGWRGYSNCSFTREMIAEVVKNLGLNLITVDWSGFGSRSRYYPKAKKNVPEVAEEVARFLDHLSSRHGVNLEQLHVVGHSLGAHVAGIAGRLVKNGKFARITGLDPAKPLYSIKEKFKILGQDSAHFVDVIHTSSDFAGIAAPIGHVDFYPNGGRVAQPGCGRDIMGKCSHRRSWKFYMESLRNPNAFPSIPCFDWDSFKRESCNVPPESVVMMGEPTPSTTRGIYFLATHAHRPFGLGMQNYNTSM